MDGKIIMHNELEITKQATVTYFNICCCTESTVQILVSTGNNMAEKKQLNKQNNFKKKACRMERHKQRKWLRKERIKRE